MRAAASFIRSLLTGATLATALAAPFAAQAADVGVSISVGDPNFYGRIDIGNVRPEVVYAQPVIIHRVHTPPPPVYLRVPPGHEKHWSKHCARYGACGRPVYFVRDDWYREVYVPQHAHGHGHGHGHDDHRDGPGRGRGPNKHDKHDKRDKHDKHDRGDRGRDH